MENINKDHFLDWTFTFESDHLALRGNSEYSRILRTITLLEAQKIQIHKDIESLATTRNKYIQKPIAIMKDIVDKKFIAPNYMCIVSIPEFERKKVEILSETEGSERNNLDIKVRGRIFDQTKPETFNQLWTCEEQRRLEQLLIEYPVEAVEMRRFAKIATALGNRTPQQVASRVQKFFKKLHSVGMPVPGRIPKSKKYALVKSKQTYRNLCRQSTFFPAHDVPVNIPEDDTYNLFGGISKAESKSLIATVFENDKLSTNKKILNILHTIRSVKTVLANDKLLDSQCRCNICLKLINAQCTWMCKTCGCNESMCEDCIIHKIINKEYAHINHDIISNTCT